MRLTKVFFYFSIVVLITIILISCIGKKETNNKDVRILFLHHSTGGVIFNAGKTTETDIVAQFKSYNEKSGVNYTITEQKFPKSKPYGWNNYPFDYYNIWVKNAGEENYKEEPTLEILTKLYDVIIFKHCFPVSDILEDSGDPDINSSEKRIENYVLQYQALKEKMHSFPETKFLIWTGAALTKEKTTEDKAKRAREFFSWVKNEWDEDGDNIFIWDFFELETEGGIYLKDEFAVGAEDPHPNEEFAKIAAPLFYQRIIDVIENNGEKTMSIGIPKQ